MYFHPLFTEKEVNCNCGCGKAFYNPQHYDRMLRLRNLIGIPLVVTSWCRCVAHNKAEGGSDTSSHLDGCATDIKAINPITRVKIAFYAGLVGMRGLGLGRDFIHLDSDFHKPPNRFWTY